MNYNSITWQAMLSYSKKAQLLDVPMSLHGLFGDAVGSFLEKFLVAQIESKVYSKASDRSQAASYSGSRKYPRPAVQIQGKPAPET